MAKQYEIKYSQIGPGSHENKELRILNRIIRWTSNGLEYEADQRHAEAVVSELAEEKGNRPVSTPGLAELQVNREGEPVLEGDEAFKFRSLTARINFLSLDRADLQFASKCLSQHMSKPSQSSWTVLNRVARYLAGAPRAILKYPWSKESELIHGSADSDWAGDRVGAKSTSGGAIQWGGNTVKTWSSTQQTIALSSGEAELYALTKCAAQVLGIMAILKDFGMVVDARLWTDSTAALGMVHREGLGRTRHIQVQYLWLQEKVRDKSISVGKVDTKLNVADLMTKFIPLDTMKDTTPV